MNLKLFNTAESNIVPENNSGKYWKRKTTIGQPFDTLYTNVLF